MSRVYRALERAEEEKKKKQEGPSINVFENIEVLKKEKPVVKIREEKRKSLGLLPREEFPVLMVSPRSFAEEEFRKLKTQLFLRLPNPPHSILVTSAVPREGKTMVAVNLAMAISKEIHKKAILIDGDLRNPGIHLGKSRTSKGLSDYLSDGTPLPEILTNSEAENLQIITAGTQTAKSSELIGSPRMGEFLKAVAECGKNAYLVIDSSPVISTTEPTLLSSMVDGIILVIMADRTPKEYVQRALKSIDRQKIIGIVLNQIDVNPSNHYSRYYYQYYQK
ncbi:MAG: CpsD/CapB family tyrosine-protein kinase [Syntrophaceae bacterium]|nr:CpsD/CapB family tyrosine-protein kinase [Syntrophaceae bacterium]